MARGPRCSAGTGVGGVLKDFLVASPFPEDQNHVHEKPRRTPEFVNGNSGRRSARFLLVTQYPKPRSYPSRPEQREGQHRNRRSQEVQPPTLAGAKQRVGRRLIRERVRENGPRNHRIKGKELRMREAAPLWSVGNCSFFFFSFFLFSSPFAAHSQRLLPERKEIQCRTTSSLSSTS